MNRMIDYTETASKWDAPAHWHRADAAGALVRDQHRRASGLLSRVIAALVAADARFRESQHIEQMDDRMRRDVGLPPKCTEARKRERLIEEARKWS